MRKLIRTSINDIYYGEINESNSCYDGIGLKREPYGEIYYGHWKDGQRDGYGVCSYSDGKIWAGVWDRDRRTDNGVTIWAVGAPFLLFAGIMEHGKPEAGTGISKDGKFFFGEWTEWRKDEFDGKGVFSWADGRIYAGNWKNGHQDNGGIIRRTNGSVNGTWQSDNPDIKTLSWENDTDRIFFYGSSSDESVRSGDGALFYADGGFYTGKWLHGVRIGNGLYRDSSGTVYVGGWKDNKKDGMGILYTPGKMLYVGRFEDDCYNGEGVQFEFIDSKLNKLPAITVSYCGDWKNGKQEGYGIQNITDAVCCYEGDWVNDHLVFRN